MFCVGNECNQNQKLSFLSLQTDGFSACAAMKYFVRHYKVNAITLPIKKLKLIQVRIKIAGQFLRYLSWACYGIVA